MQHALDTARHQGGTVFFGARVLDETYPHAYYVTPALVQVPTQVDIVRAETFAPILYVIPIRPWTKRSPSTMRCPKGWRPPSSPRTCARLSILHGAVIAVS